MKTIRLMTHDNIEIKIHHNFHTDPTNVNIGYHDDDDFDIMTFKDIAIILYYLAPNGLQRQLANELSKKLNIDKRKINGILHDLVVGYKDLSEDEAYDKWEENMKEFEHD